MEIITNTGTDLKISVQLGCGGLTMDDFDFTCDFFTTSAKVITIAKEQMKREDAGCYIAIVPTEGMTSGNIRMSVRAVIPDSDVPGGYRHENATRDTGITIRK